MKVLKNEEGLTLIEAIVALVLMIVLVAAFSGAFVTGLNREVEVDKRMDASNLATGIVEYLKDDGLDVNNLTYPIDLQNEKFSGLDDDLLFLSLRKGESRVEVSQYSDDENPIDGLYKINIKIVWEDRDNDNWTHELVTLLAGE